MWRWLAGVPCWQDRSAYHRKFAESNTPNRAACKLSCLVRSKATLSSSTIQSRSAPDFTSVEFFRAFHFRKASDGGYYTAGDGNVSVMLVGQVMCVDIFRPGNFQKCGYISDRFRFRRVLDDPAGEVEQYLGRIFANDGRFLCSLKRTRRISSSCNLCTGHHVGTRARL